MFESLHMYGRDDGASLYATAMHSDSGYLVTDSKGKGSYGGYLTWDDHFHSARQNNNRGPVSKVLNNCAPFGCANNRD